MSWCQLLCYINAKPNDWVFSTWFRKQSCDGGETRCKPSNFMLNSLNETVVAAGALEIANVQSKE